MPKMARLALDRCATVQHPVKEPKENEVIEQKHLPNDIIKVEKNVLGHVLSRLYYNSCQS